MNDTPKAEPQGALGDDEAAAAAAGKQKTRYMVLWSPVPKEDDHEFRWREVGWYEAHSAAGARKLGGHDQDSGQYGQLFDAAKGGPVALRAVAQSSWPDLTDDDLSGVETTSTLVIR